MPPHSHETGGDADAVDAALRQAVTHQRAGRLGEALRLYDDILAAEPANAAALNFAGAAHVQLGNLEHGVELLKKATVANPRYAEAHRNLGIALRDAGRLEEAMAAFRRVVDIAPQSAEGYNDLGIVLRKSGRLEEARAAYARALEIKPDYVDACVNLGNVLMKQEKLIEAGESYQRAATINPQDPRIHRRLGIALQIQGKFDAAIASYRRALAIKPDFALAHADLGSAWVEQGHPEEGAACLRQAVQLSPHDANIHASLGIALQDLGELEGALRAYDACLALDPGNSHVLAYKIIVLHVLGRREEEQQLLAFNKLLYAEQAALPHGYESLPNFYAALADYACTHPTLKSGGANNTTRNGGQTEDLFAAPEGPVTGLARLVHKAVRSYINTLAVDPAHPLRAKMPQQIRLTGWATVLDNGGYQDPHTHPYGWLSGVYYVRVPSSVAASDPGHAGWIEFGRPNDRYYRESGYEIKRVQPVEGLLLLFPSYFWHRTLPFESGEKRISYAFDVLPGI